MAKYRPVKESRVGSAKIVEAAGGAAGLGAGEIRSIGVNTVYHIGRLKSEYISREGGGVVEEAVRGLHGSFGRMGLKGSEGTHSLEHGGINRPSIIQ